MKTQIIPLLFLLLTAAACQSSSNNDTVETGHVTTLPEPTDNAPLDSLLQLAVIAKQDTNLAKLYFDIAEIYLGTDHTKAKEYYLKCKTLSETLNWNQGRYLFAMGYTDILNYEGLVDSALFIHLEVLELAKKDMNEHQIAVISSNIANCYNYKGWYETALGYYHEAIAMFEKRGDKFRLAHAYSLIGTVYEKINMYDEQLLYTEKSVNMQNEKPDDIFRANALVNYAIALNNNRQFEKAENSLLEAQRIYLLHNHRYGLIPVYSNLNTITLQKKDFRKSETYARQMLDVVLEFGDVQGYCIANRSLSYLELYKRNFDKAEDYAKEALTIAYEFDLPVEKMKLYATLADISIARHDFLQYKYFMEKFDSVQKTVFADATMRAAKEMEAKYETEKKEHEIDRQQNIITQQNTQRNVLISGVAVSIVFLVLLWYMLRLRIKRNRILAETNATKDQFFSIISHDLKNPTVALRDNLKLLVHNVRLWDVDTLTEHGNELLKSAEGQVELLNSLLNWARLQTGRMTYTPEKFNLSAMLPDIFLIRKMAETKGLTFSATIPDDTLVVGDFNMLSTVVRNLLTNAVKFTASGDTVNLSVEPTTAGNYVVAVSDTGTGMSEEQVRNLFNLDKLQYRHGTANEEGTGLGLIVCRELLEKHGSTLHVESEEGKGSKFWFELKTES
jgi:signal transduction histidine kinase